MRPVNDSPIFYHIGGGNYKEATLQCYGLEDKVSTLVDLDLSVHDQHLEALVASEHKPRAMVLQAWPVGRQPTNDKFEHFYRAMSLVDQQVRSGLGFILCVEPSFDQGPLPQEVTNKIDDLMKSSFAEKTFVFKSRSGIAATDDSSCLSYLISNIGEVHQAVRSCPAKDDERLSLDSRDQFVGLLDSVLDHVGDSRCSERPNCNDKHVAKRLRRWLFVEELCDQDMATHSFLQECYPSESAWKKARRIRDPAAQNNTLDPRDLEDEIDDAVGEAIEDVVEATADDYTVPTEQQQREVMSLLASVPPSHLVTKNEMALNQLYQNHIKT